MLNAETLNVETLTDLPLVLPLLQLAPELQVWETLLAELCRQAHAECSQRGALLLSAITRQQQMLHSALSACDSLHSAMQQAAAAAQQQRSSMQTLEQQMEWAQQQNEQLTVGATAAPALCKEISVTGKQQR
jgi:hypothetical protein